MCIKSRKDILSWNLISRGSQYSAEVENIILCLSAQYNVFNFGWLLRTFTYMYSIMQLKVNFITISNLISSVQEVHGVISWWRKKPKAHVILMTFSYCVWKVLEILSNQALDICILGLESHTPLMSKRTKPENEDIVWHDLY